MRNYFLLFGSLFGLFAIALGAFGAHLLEAILTPLRLQRYHTGVEYQFYHALALLATGLWYHSQRKKTLYYAGWAFVTGTILFSGSLYLYVATGMKAFAFITPLGGFAFIIGWSCLSYAAWHETQ